MLPDLQQVYGEVDKASLPYPLDRPTINLDAFQIMYMEQTLDDTHIIKFEFGNDFEEFFYFSIDG